MKLSKELKIAVNAEIRRECRHEAMNILQLGDDKDREDFLKYHNEDQGNICFLVLDFAKKKLVEKGIQEDNDCDCFKTPEEL